MVIIININKFSFKCYQKQFKKNSVNYINFYLTLFSKLQNYCYGDHKYMRLGLHTILPNNL